MGLISEFRKFAMRGNVIDMAVGIIIGAAFGKIVSALVENVMMPPIGLLLGGVDFSDKKILLKAASEDGATPAVFLEYGIFINALINFLIVAFAVFLLIKAVNKATDQLKKEEEAKPEAPPELSMDQKLLTEIRDLLSKNA